MNANQSADRKAANQIAPMPFATNMQANDYNLESSEKIRRVKANMSKPEALAYRGNTGNAGYGLEQAVAPDGKMYLKNRDFGTTR